MSEDQHVRVPPYPWSRGAAPGWYQQPGGGVTWWTGSGWSDVVVVMPAWVAYRRGWSEAIEFVAGAVAAIRTNPVESDLIQGGALAALLGVLAGLRDAAARSVAEHDRKAQPAAAAEDVRDGPGGAVVPAPVVSELGDRLRE